MIKKTKLSKILIFICLIIAFLTPVISFSDNSFKNQKPNNTNLTLNNNLQWKCYDKKKHFDSELLQIVKKYSPETLDNWEKVLQENRNLRKDLFKLYKNRKKVMDSYESSRKEEKIKFLKRLRKQVENNEITKEEAKEKIKQYRCQYKTNEKKSNRSNKHKLELYKTKKKLMQAVKKNDVNQIKNSLNKLYIDYKNLNSDLNNRIDKMKKEK